MKLAQWNYIGPRSTPQEVRTLRESSFDFHKNLGQPVIHKHRWNERDVRNGLAQHCPFHDVVLGSDREFDPYCFGTGFLGGWSDGVVTFVTIADSQEDRIKIGPQGVLLFDTHPAFTAPWIPDMGDGDLLITAEFVSNKWDIVDEIDRYVLQDVTPKTMRGFEGRRKGSAGYKVHQEGNLDKLPLNHEWQAVPIIFAYDTVPPSPYPPIGSDPSNYPVLNPGEQISFFEVGAHVIGRDDGVRTSYSQIICVQGAGNTSEIDFGIRVNTDGPGTNIYFEDS